MLSLGLLCGAVLLFLTNLVWRICSLFPFCFVALAKAILVYVVIFFCIVLYGPMSPTMTPLFYFGRCSFCLFGFWFGLLCFLCGRFFGFIAL
jgi:hypothetical protein